MIQPMGVNSERLYRPGKPVRDPVYLKWIRSLPCIECKSRRQVEAAHTGPHGMSQKASDYSAIPLCRKHHQEFDAGPRHFEERHLWTASEIVVQLNAMWFEAVARRKTA